MMIVEEEEGRRGGARGGSGGGSIPAAPVGAPAEAPTEQLAEGSAPDVNEPAEALLKKFRP